MAKAHVLDTNGALTRVAFHITVPNGNNAASIPWTTAIKNSGMGGKTSLPDGDGTGGTISLSEKTSVVTDGTIYEVTKSVPIPTGMNLSQANAFLDALHAEAVTEEQGNVTRRLNYYGFTRT